MAQHHGKRFKALATGFDPGKLITGQELTALSEDSLTGCLSETRLFCRVTPQQKLRVIMALKRMGLT